MAENKKAFAPIGNIGTPIYGGIPYSNESNSNLIGDKKWETYSEILANTSIVAAGTRYFLNLVASAGWSVLPADVDSKEDKDRALEIAETVENIIKDLETPWHRVVRRAAMYRFWGFSIQEWTAKKREDGTIGLWDIEPRSQRTIEKWDVGDHGKVIGVTQVVPQTYQEVYLPRWKIVYTVDDSINDAPDGLGLFRHVVDSAKRLSRYEQLEGIGYEVDLRGVPIGRAPLADLEKMVTDGEITEEQRDTAITGLQGFVANHIKSQSLGMILDSSPYLFDDDSALIIPFTSAMFITGKNFANKKKHVKKKPNVNR